VLTSLGVPDQTQGPAFADPVAAGEGVDRGTRRRQARLNGEKQLGLEFSDPLWV
jgi:hypothetical protein